MKDIMQDEVMRSVSKASFNVVTLEKGKLSVVGDSTSNLDK